MKLLSKIRALFTHQTEGPVDMPLAAAEIRRNRVYLHPADNPRKTIRIRATAVDLRINPEETVNDGDMIALKGPEGVQIKKDGSQQLREKTTSATKRPRTEAAPYKEPMKTISFRVYQEEYDSLMNIISSNGYRKAEYLLACVHAAKKNSLETTYQRYFDSHNQRKRAEREAARQYRAEQAKAALVKEP